MIFHRQGLINKHQKGFTVVELIIAIAISGVIAGAGTTAIFQVITGSARSNNHMTAVRQVQNAGYRVSRDAQMAQSVVFDDPATTEVLEFLTLSWTDWDSDDGHRVAYTLESISGSGLKNLQRSYSVNDGEPDETIVAQYVDPSPTKTDCDFTGGKLTFTVTVTISSGLQQESETRVYEITPRPSPSQLDLVEEGQ